ncbi:hypothetical protein BFP72_06835 [Reichenbachiella sp. 5M10]|uniref:RNA polymerase sigma-70 factor n=1 Tax=Reichenbachiella sp. 5M10 TaxID=1889772 RepID=UPI000C15EEEB|nr:RNA polymerase sigma-70 factor [Reichenbachiella sp. 5M10]PIB35130.1 hypothetical protein BFP72_06835 [Reichenbachiella sp. 5M10]
MTTHTELHITDLSDERSFERVFKALYQPLIRFAYQYLSDEDLAEEIVQETFTSLWQKAKDIEIKTSIKSYLYGAVRNACLNNLKHQKVVRAHEETVKHQSDAMEEDFLELDELQDKIDRALDQLPEKCREIFEMSRFEEMKYKEIAEQLQISIKTVETQMSRALKVMRTALGQYLVSFLLGLFYWIENNL